MSAATVIEARSRFFRCTLLLLLLLAIALPTSAQRQMENLGRGVVAVRSSSTQAFVSWRLLALDPAGIQFNVYRSANGGAAVKLNVSPLSGGCNYTDTTANFTQTNAYHVRPVISGVEQGASAAWTLPPNVATEPLFRIPLKTPHNRKVHHVWAGDVDGDGEYEFFACLTATNTVHSQKLAAYKRNGTFLWEVDFGPNSVNPDNIYVNAAAISAGQWDGVTVYDLDSDGRAEVIVKSANGVTFGDGTTLFHGDDITQFISVLNGLTGAERTRAELPNPWKAAISRPLGTLFGIGYPDGVRPSLMIHAKNRNPSLSFNLIESSWDFRNGVLSNRWTLQWHGDGPEAPVNSHQMRIVDVNGDGKDELVPGMHAINGNGTLLWNLGDQGIVHGDRFHISDLDPNRPGLEMYGIQQNNVSGLMEYFSDAATGATIWTVNVPPPGGDAARGVSADIDPRFPGLECWSFGGIRTATGTVISSNSFPWPNLQVWWDGDVLGEVLNTETVDKWNYTSLGTSRLLTAYNYGANAATRDVPAFVGDILGDWREEIVFEELYHRELLVFTTTSFTTNRIYTLAQNPAYRNCLTVKGYVQENLPDYYLGWGMSNPPVPNITYSVTNPLPATPSAPTGLSATAVSDSQIQLAWTDNSTNEESFRIERSTNGVNFTQVGLVIANVTNFADSPLFANTTYYYRVCARNLGGPSAYSATASATTFVLTQMVKSDTTTMNTAADWSGFAPTINEVGIFNNVISAPNAAALTLGANTSVRGLIFNGSLNGPVSVAAGNTLTLGAAGIDMSLANQTVTFNNAIALAASQAWNVAGGRTLNFNGALTNASSALVKTGAGTLRLGSSVNEPGATIQVDAGTVQADVSSGLQLSLNGGTFNINVFDSNPIHVMSGGGTEQNVGGNRTWAGNLTGSGPLTVVASSIHTWSGNNSDYSGTITLQGGGTLRLNSVNAVSAATAYHFNSGTMTPNVNGLFRLGALSGVGSIFTSAGRNFSIGDLGNDTVFAGVIDGAGFVAKEGEGTLTLSGANTYSTGTMVSNGVLQIGNGGTTGVPGPGNITNHATLAFNRSNAFDDSSFGIISGTGHVNQRGAGRLIFTKTHSYSGATTVEAGTLALTNSASIANSSGIVIFSGAVLDVSGLSTGSMTLASGRTLSGDGAVKGNFIIAGGGNLLPGQDGIGQLTFSNSLTLSAGSTQIFEINRLALTNDAVRVFGALTNGGTLVVTNIGDALAAGDSFKLLHAASHGGVFNTYVLPPLSSGLLWNTTTLPTNGTLAVITAAPPLINSYARLGDGNFRLNFSGTSGQPYEVRATTNLLVTPVTNWQLLTSGMFNGSAVVFDDLQATNFPQRYYLIRLP